MFKRNVEMCGPAPIAVELEQTLYMVSWNVNHAKTDVKISSAYGLMVCMEINVHERCKIKPYSRTLIGGA